jgi:hypothetical protein
VQAAHALIDAGHYTLRARAPSGEPIQPPGGWSWVAATTDTTRGCFEAGVCEIELRRSRGERADLALMIGDLALPAGHREMGPWMIPGSYREILAAHGLEPACVRILGEAYCRNQGKRRLLDEVRTRGLSPEQTYAEQGWALLADAIGLRLVSDASLEWDGDLKVVALTRGSDVPLCPLVFAGLKRWVFRQGYTEHTAIYALADDPYVDVKLRAAATAVVQLQGGRAGEQIHRLLEGIEERFSPQELVGPGAMGWSRFFSRAQGAHPGLCRIEEAEWSPLAERACGTRGKTSSRCSG